MARTEFLSIQQVAPRVAHASAARARAAGPSGPSPARHTRVGPHPARGRTGVVLAACAFILAACESPPPLSKERRVEFSEDAAAVYVSAYPAVPWSAIAEKMEPNFNVSAADARKLAAVTTQAKVDQFLSTFSASLGISLPLRTRSSQSSTVDSTTTSSATSTLASPSVPGTGTPTSISDAALAADLSKMPTFSGLDGASELQGAAAIYQLAKVLDHQITKSISPKGYEAHLVTFQVNLQPTSRNLPYDAYVNVTLMPGSWQQAVALTKDDHKTPDALPPVVVYPLIISDATEASSVGKSTEVVRQAALQLSGIVSNVGLGLGASGGTDKLSAILASDRNSLVTVGRVSDHTLRIRLGAVNQGTTQLAIVPRTQNVSVVVFTKTHATDEKRHIGRLAAITQTRLVDVETGVALRSRRSGDDARKQLRDQVVRELRQYQFQLNQGCLKDDEYSPLDVLSSLDRGDYAAVGECLQDIALPEPEPQTPQAAPKAIRPLGATSVLPSSAGLAPVVAPSSAREARLRRAIARLMTMQAESRYSKLMVELSPFKDQTPMLPRQDQFASLADDGKAAAVTLRGGAHLKDGGVRAALLVRHSVGSTTATFALLPTELKVANGGKDVAMTFPSLGASKIMSAVTSVTGTPTHHLLQLQSLDNSQVVGTQTYTLHVEPAKDKDKDASVPSPLSLGSSGIVSQRSGRGSLQIKVGKWDAAKDGKLYARVQGAELVKIEGGTLDADKDAIVVQPGSVLKLTLGNLQPWIPVSVQALANDKILGKPLNLVVERVR